MNQWFDLHTHTLCSDGALTPTQLCEKAQRSGLKVMAITDHNRTVDLTALRTAFADIRLIQGAEISCLYTDTNGTERELHVVALGFDPQHPKIQAVLSHNQPDRQPYIDAILDKLRLCGIDLGDYASLCRRYPDKGYIGRMLLAKLMAERGDVPSIDRAFDEYLGAHGERKAYVPNPLRYVTLEEAVDAVLEAGGVAVLAHLYYYLLDDAQIAVLLRRFKALTGDRGAMEVQYARYDATQRAALKALADQYGLMHSAASDFHGQNPSEHLEHRFEAQTCAPLLRTLGVL